jgi:polyisoprenoid-binding protein YceI
MHRSLAAAALSCAFALAAAPASAQPELLPAQSEIGFVCKQMGVPVEGGFTRFAAVVDFDPRRPQGGAVSLTVDLASAVLPTEEAQDEVAKSDWFDTRKFPRAEFRSSSIRALGPGRYEIAGSLTIKGRARELVVPLTLAQSGAVTVASGSFSIRRLDFGVGDGEWSDTSIVGDDVRVRFKLALKGIASL